MKFSVRSLKKNFDVYLQNSYNSFEVFKPWLIESFSFSAN